MDYASIVGLVTFLVMMIMIFAGIPVFVSMLASAFGGFPFPELPHPLRL